MDTFRFFIVRMPYRDSNLTSKVFYESIASKILPLARTNSERPPFINTAKILQKRIYKQGCKWEHLKKVLSKMHDRHVTDFKTFAYTAEKLIDHLPNF